MLNLSINDLIELEAYAEKTREKAEEIATFCRNQRTKILAGVSTPAVQQGLDDLKFKAEVLGKRKARLLRSQNKAKANGK
ncbi:hypothetical protein [Paraflavitalea sp. CAU 1676]|uniref:hypothetical protein n=1 Tax=Paraflavitalea sp. CAU 1676 TaxID=3032598 RepID=UPI0023DA674D|nr:hypothetical protein [Paraflavitalea sp. CAU 1676]MDF2189327.1 hypothetical protein [Paraflavitalea sp. CAU 1676]